MHKLAILAILGGCADGAVVLTRSMKTISHAVKGVGYTYVVVRACAQAKIVLSHRTSGGTIRTYIPLL